MTIRSSTARRVHRATLHLAEELPLSALTMEGIAARAGVGKQTLYRNWGSVADIVLDTLRVESEEAEEIDAVGDPVGVLVDVLEAATLEMSTAPREGLLRSLAAQMQLDEAFARRFLTTLWEPQKEQVHRLLKRLSVSEPADVAERLFAPMVYRWFLRMPALTRAQLDELVRASL